MIKTITSLLRNEGTLRADLEIDHIELAGDHLILGVKITWSNNTRDPMEIREVLIELFHKGKKESPVQFHYNGRFVRIPYQKTITKIAGATSFHIKSHAKQVESLRFLTREIEDLTDGSYPAELHSVVSGGTYLHHFDLQVASRFKYQASPHEGPSNPIEATSSSIYSRAKRLGLTQSTSGEAAD